MPFHKKVNRLWFTVHRKTINYKQSTINRKSLGFTLIELLVVISIIGILASFVTVAYSITQAKSRDSKRKNDLRQTRTTLQLYYQDKGGFPCFPSGGCGWASLSGLGPVLEPTYMPKVPTDPKGDICGYFYSVSTPGTGSTRTVYTIFTKLENTQDQDALAVKPAPVGVDNVGELSLDGKTFKVTLGSCLNYDYNYWVINS